jgi:hypothetical protein
MAIEGFDMCSICFQNLQNLSVMNINIQILKDGKGLQDKLTCKKTQTLKSKVYFFGSHFPDRGTFLLNRLIGICNFSGCLSWEPVKDNL